MTTNMTLASSIKDFTPAPTSAVSKMSTPTVQAVTPPKSSPAIITSKAATTDLNNIKNNVTEINTGIQNQAQKLAAEKTAAETKAAADAKAKADADNKAKELAIKEAALKETGTTTTDGSTTPVDGVPTQTADEKALSTTSSEYETEAKNVRDTILNIQNGAVPLTAGEQAQIEGLKQQFQVLIDQQKLSNTGAEGLGNVRGYQTGSAEYDPTFQVKTIGSIITSGMNKISDLNIKMSAAVAEMTQGFKDNKISAIKNAWDVYSTAAKDRTTTLTNSIKEANAKIKEANDAKAEAMKPIQELAKSASNNGATPDVVNKILSSPDLATAYSNAGGFSAGGSGIVGEYNFYKAQATAAGQTPLSFTAYQNEDANRKRSIASAGTTVSGLNPKQVTIFNSLVDKQNKSPLIAANDRAVILKNISSELEKDPTNAALQVSFIYSMVQALDTYQSSVREGEIGLLSSTQGLGDKLNNILPKLEKGNPLAETKVKEYLKVANTLTNSIEGAASAKRKAFESQAKVAGVGDAFKEYQDSVYGTGTTSGNLIKTEEEAKTKVNEIYKNATPEVANTIKTLIKNNYNNLKVIEYLKAKGQITE